MWAGMTGSDCEGVGHVSQAELGTFKQDMANEVAQLQAALQRTVNDIVDATRSPAPVSYTHLTLPTIYSV